MAQTVNLEGHHALVTGGTRGIGRAVAEVLARSGCSVALTARQAPDCEAVAADIRLRFAVNVLGVASDVSVQASVDALFEQVGRWSGDRLDILVCNAGFPFQEELFNTPLHNTPAGRLEEWYLSVFRTDTLGSVFCTYRALPLMMRSGGGSIIYMSSTPALEGFQGAPYTVAKAGLLGLMKDVAREYGRCNIRANALALGNIMTPATVGQLDDETKRRFAQEAPLGRWGTPEEVAEAALFLASGMSGFMTGQTLVLDGGTVRR